MLAIGTLGAWAFLALVPRIGGWFTRMGAATLVVYLFHGFVVKGAELRRLQRLGRGPRRDLGFAVTTLAAVLLSPWRSPGARSPRGSTARSSTRSGYAERHVKHAVDLTVAKDQVQPEVQAEVEAGSATPGCTTEASEVGSAPAR